VPKGISTIPFSLQKPGFNLFAKTGGEGNGSFGAIKSAVIAQKIIKSTIINPKTADLLYFRRRVNSPKVLSFLI